MNSTGISQFNQARVEWAIRLRYSPMPKLDMELLASELNAFRIGELRTVGKTWEVMMERDGELAINSEKRKADSACLEWQISSDGSPDGDKHAAALQYFYNNLSATKALDQDATGSVDELVFQTLSAVDFYYSAHEILLRIDNPAAKEVTAEFRHTPVWFFEARRGYLGYLKHIFDMYGQPCLAGEWLTAVNTGWMRQLTMPYCAKWMSMRDWLLFSERYGSGFLEAISNATKDSQEWNDAANALVTLANQGTILHNRDVEFKFVEQSSRNQLPYQPVVELVDRLYAKCYRGVDLATGSRAGEAAAGGGRAGSRNPVGASVQKEESGILLVRDAKWITGVFNDRIDRPILRYLFNEEPRAWFALLPPLDDTSSEDLQSLQTLVPMGLRVALKEVYKRFRWSVPDEGDACLEAPAGGGNGESTNGGNGEKGGTPKPRSTGSSILPERLPPEQDGLTREAQTQETTPIAAGADPNRNPGLLPLNGRQNDSTRFNSRNVDNPLLALNPQSAIRSPQSSSRQMPDTQVDAGAFWSRVGLAPRGADGQTLPMPSLGYAVPNGSGTGVSPVRSQILTGAPMNRDATSKLADRHADLVARGLSNSRAAQALHREINRRLEQEASQLDLPRRSDAKAGTQNSKPETQNLPLPNTGFNPDEPRDSQGRWTTDGGTSATNNPAQTNIFAPEAARPVAEKLAQNAFTTLVARPAVQTTPGNPFRLTGAEVNADSKSISPTQPISTAQVAPPNFTLQVATDPVYPTYGDYVAAHPEALRRFAHPGATDSPAAAIGKFFGTLGRTLSGGLADLGETITGNPTHENISAALAGEPMPMVAESRLLPTPLRIFERGAQGLVESAPKIGAVAAMQAGGVPAPLAAGLVFGTTEQGFDPRQAVIAAALPFLGKYSGAITEAIASKAGVSSEAALQAFNKIGGAGGAAALIGADQWRQISNLPPEQRKEAFIEAAANVASTFLLGTLGEGERDTEGEQPPQRSLTPSQKARYPRAKHGERRRAETWERSKAPDGKVYDPTGPEIKPDEPWQMGHRPGHKFSDAQREAVRQNMDPKTWNQYQRDPDIYRPEKPRTNLNHKSEFDY